MPRCVLSRGLTIALGALVSHLCGERARQERLLTVEVGVSDSGVSQPFRGKKELLTALKFPLRVWNPV